ncbi:MAG: LytS/YhcK type 5TM receptor domain-containing protein [Candidatus Accumulibacter sp.]|uniref:LytS/YhcK type 5TM receptor domain-containing protein n=1 Tax=Accumulibacter sp. TaxID=2053492 RepID=UPI0028793527|nr:LytS/YhcK type 5TM receptor domain-containing protein [Accumulibacter sp.]MDS4015692.1 LytS/YhcK type 5TM receptor domain-containing protein [Accumulibacter sp.]
MADTRILLKTVAIALPFGFAAFLCIYGGLALYVPGTQIITDPREIFVTLGGALTGPAGALLIGVLAGIYDPVPGLYPATIAMHVTGALWMAFAYKKLVFERFSSWLFFPAWIALVAAYYLAFVMPVFVLATSLLPDLSAQVFPDGLSAQALATFYRAVIWPELVLTSLITAAILALLPMRLRKPLW